MDIKFFLSAFSTVFLAELGDKTQLAALSLASKSKAPLTVFLGSVSAYIVVTLLTVLLGQLLGKFIPVQFIRFGAASAFIVIGILMFIGKI
ncbi:MAG: TMEM165/GDT1 family protein [Candidatus Omnitrophica bacterium]|nr:TMEM165/GDT1 family protein [Candidatus Omnitrophota bacterium]